MVHVPNDDDAFHVVNGSEVVSRYRRRDILDCRIVKFLMLGLWERYK